MRLHHDASEPYEAQKQRAGLKVLTSSIGTLGWAILRSRPNKGLPEKAKEHLAMLFEQVLETGMGCIAENLKKNPEIAFVVVLSRCTRALESL